MLAKGQLIQECYSDYHKMLKIGRHPIMALGRVKTMEVVYIDDHPWIRVEWGEPGFIPEEDTFINVQKVTHIVLKNL